MRDNLKTPLLPLPVYPHELVSIRSDLQVIIRWYLMVEPLCQFTQNFPLSWPLLINNGFLLIERHVCPPDGINPQILKDVSFLIY